MQDFLNFVLSYTSEWLKCYFSVHNGISTQLDAVPLLAQLVNASYLRDDVTTLLIVGSIPSVANLEDI